MKKHLYFIDENQYFELVDEWYLNVSNSDLGFRPSDVEKYAHKFILADSKEELDLEVKKFNHAKEYGPCTGSDVICSRCGYGYDIDPYGSEGDIREKIVIPCICGCKIIITPIVKISYETKYLT